MTTNEMVQELKEVVQSDDLELIEAFLFRMPLEIHQKLFDGGIFLAMPEGSLATIEYFFNRGGKLKPPAMNRGIARDDTAVFQTLIDAGWDMNSSEHGYAAVQ
jgi:hypothetical protein